jgi:hypothetical protein
MGSQKFVDCLIKNGADPSATDSTGRTAQISDLLNTGCKVKTKFELALPTETDYSNFVHHPMEYFLQSEKHMYSFETISIQI